MSTSTQPQDSASTNNEKEEMDKFLQDALPVYAPLQLYDKELEDHTIEMMRYHNNFNVLGTIKHAHVIKYAYERWFVVWDTYCKFVEDNWDRVKRYRVLLDLALSENMRKIKKSNMERSYQNILNVIAEYDKMYTRSE